MVIIIGNGLVWFGRLRWQSNSCRRTIVVLFNVIGGDQGIHTFSESISLKVNVVERHYSMWNSFTEEMELATRNQIQDEVDSISLGIKTLEKGMNPSPPKDWYIFVSTSYQTLGHFYVGVLGKEELWQRPRLVPCSCMWA